MEWKELKSDAVGVIHILVTFFMNRKAPDIVLIRFV